jgi:hypothetical protein
MTSKEGGWANGPKLAKLNQRQVMEATLIKFMTHQFNVTNIHQIVIKEGGRADGPKPVIWR